MAEALFDPIAFGRYQLVERIAIGGMAEIFKAKTYGSHGFEKTLAVKRILPQLAADPEFVEMFINEARLMVRLNHPKIVQVLDFGQVDDQYFMAMEYVHGVDGLALLRICAKHRCRPTTGIAVHIAADILDALDYAHNLCDEQDRPLGIVHRDISPSNIFVSELGEVKLGDFGIARGSSRAVHTETGGLKGKYGYMSPEIVNGASIDHRSDIFSVGVLLAELLMVRRLYIAKNELEVLLQVRDARLDRLNKYGRHIPPELRRIIDASLARDPERRYQDAASFRDALHNFLFEQKRMIRPIEVRSFLQRLRDLDSQGDTPTIKRATLRTKVPAPVQARPATPVAAASGVSSPPTESAPVEHASRGRPSAEVASVQPPVPSQPKPDRQSEYWAKTRERIQVAPKGVAPSGREVELDKQVTRLPVDHKPGTGSRSADSASVAPPPSQAGTRKPATGQHAPVKGSADPGHDVPTLAPLVASGSWPTEPPVIGRRRKITLGPPPRPTPVRTALPLEVPKAENEDGVAALTELENSGSSTSGLERDFRVSRSGPKPVPPAAPVISPADLAKVAAVQVTATTGGAAPPPTLQGDFSQRSLANLLFQMATDEETGMLLVQQPPTIKEIYLVDGDPQYVTSNASDELFGQYLVRRGVISEGELAMALAILPHFEGKLGDALVALKLIRPVHVLRHLTHQVRQKLLNTFAWESGSYAYYPGRTSKQQAAPLGLDAFEIVGGGVAELPEDVLMSRLQPRRGIAPKSVSPPPVPPEIFRLGPGPRKIFDQLDGRFRLDELLSRYDDPEERVTFARIVYLLLETGLAAAV